MPPRGALIVFEGADRSGKTTQTSLCVDALRKAGVEVAPGSPWCFPDRTTAIGQMINSYLRNKAEMDDHVLHLLFAANRWEKADVIRKTLERGTTLVVDRYAFSGVAYSAAKGLDPQWCKTADVGLPDPDVVIYLDMPFEVASKREGFGDERYEKAQMQLEVRRQFKLLSTANWKVVAANHAPEEVHASLMGAVEDAVKDALRGAPLRTLWTSSD